MLAWQGYHPLIETTEEMAGHRLSEGFQPLSTYMHVWICTELSLITHLQQHPFHLPLEN